MNYISDPRSRFQNNDYGITVPRMDAINEGYVYGGVNERGSLRAIPDSYTLNDMNVFYENIDDGITISQNPHVTSYMNDERYSVLNSMGITSDPSKGDNFRPIGVDAAGKTMYSSQTMLTSKDHQLGSKMLKNSMDVIGGFKQSLNKDIFEPSEAEQIQTIADNSQDTRVLDELNVRKNEKDSEGFIDTVFDFFTSNKSRVTKKGRKEGKVKKDEEPGGLMDSLSTAYQAYAMYELWDYLSPAQKAAGLVNVGVKSIELATGEKLGNKVLVDATLKADGTELTPPLKVSDALNFFNLGLNAYSLAKNWDQLSDTAKLLGGSRTVLDIARTAQSLGLLGEGVNSAAVKASEASLAAAGYKSVPHLGVGALIGPADATVPEGYTVVTYTNDAMSSTPGGKNAVIVPTKNADTARGTASSAGSLINTGINYGTAALSAYGAYQSIKNKDYVGGAIHGMQAFSSMQRAMAGGAAAASTGGASLAGAGAAGAGVGTGAGVGAGVGGGAVGAGVGREIANQAAAQGASEIGLGQTIGGYAGIAAGAYMLYQGWGQGGTEGVVNGALGGASMAGGLAMLGYSHPYLMAAVVAVGALSGLFKNGKHEDQIGRDQVRSRFKEIGLVDGDWNVRLADGTLVDIGQEDTRHRFLDPVKGDKYGVMGGDYELHPYDVDFTNDVSAMASLGGVALSRIICGGTAHNIDQMGGQLSNAFIANVDWEDGKLTEEKWNKIAANQRSVYAQAGIKSKSDAFALANQLYAEGRINDFELVQMHQSFNMMYDDNGWETAQKLAAGRWNGIDVAAEKADVEDPRTVDVSGTGKEQEEQQAAA